MSFPNGFTPYDSLNFSNQKLKKEPIENSLPSSPEETQPKEDHLFEKKLFRKLQKHVDHPLYTWVWEFANKLAYYAQDTREFGIGLVNVLLDFPKESELALALRDHLQELLYSTQFLNQATFIDEWAINPAVQLLKKFTFAVEVTTKSYPLKRLSEIPEHLIMNDLFISDPRIKLYNLFIKAGGIQLSVTDDTLEMQVAFICAHLREQLLQKFIPANIKNRPDQVHFVKSKVNDPLGLIENPKTEERDEKNVNIVYKRMTDLTIKHSILKGSDDFKYSYIHSDDRKSCYTVPIPKNQGYANPQLLIEHLSQCLNTLDQHTCILSRIKDRIHAHDEADSSETIKEYIDIETGKITQAGTRALLYSLGYLCERPKTLFYG